MDAPGSRWTANTLQKVLAPSLIGYSRPSGQLSPGELRGEYIRQQMIIGKLFEIRRDYWTGLRETEPRHSNTRYSGEGASMSQNNRVDSSFIEHYDGKEIFSTSKDSLLLSVHRFIYSFFTPSVIFWLNFINFGFTVGFSNKQKFFIIPIFI